MKLKRKSLRFLGRDKKGQARTIDFLIAFSLFILFIAQILILMTSLQYQIILEQSPTTNQKNTFTFADKILRRPGMNDTNHKDWGDSPGSIKNFGLAVSQNISELNWSAMYYLDPAKLARINPLLANTGSLTLRNYWLPYQEVKALLNMSEREDFSIEVLPAFNLSLTIPTPSNPPDIDLTVQIMDARQNNIESVVVTFYAKAITSNEVLKVATTVTDADGRAYWTFTPTATENYIILAAASLTGAALWATDLVFCDDSGTEIDIDAEHMFFTANQLIYWDTNPATVGERLLFYDGINISLSNELLRNSSAVILNTTAEVRTNSGKFIFALVIDDGSVKIASIPEFFYDDFAYKSTIDVDLGSITISSVSLIVNVNHVLVRARIKIWRYAYGL
ncbi:MAG: Ig-like domain-containing protein [Candidatus Hermodarchaeota archaeon]